MSRTMTRMADSNLNIPVSDVEHIGWIQYVDISLHMFLAAWARKDGSGIGVFEET